MKSRTWVFWEYWLIVVVVAVVAYLLIWRPDCGLACR